MSTDHKAVLSWVKHLVWLWLGTVLILLASMYQGEKNRQRIDRLEKIQNENRQFLADLLDTIGPVKDWPRHAENRQIQRLVVPAREGGFWNTRDMPPFDAEEFIGPLPENKKTPCVSPVTSHRDKIQVDTTAEDILKILNRHLLPDHFQYQGPPKPGEKP